MNEIENMITQLEHQRAAIDNALAALREVSGEASASKAQPAKATKKSGKASGRQRQIEAMRAYWAAKKGAAKNTGSKKAAKKSGLTAAGRKRLSDNMRKRWAAKRAK